MQLDGSQYTQKLRNLCSHHVATWLHPCDCMMQPNYFMQPCEQPATPAPQDRCTFQQSVSQHVILHGVCVSIKHATQPYMLGNTKRCVGHTVHNGTMEVKYKFVEKDAEHLPRVPGVWLHHYVT